MKMKNIIIYTLLTVFLISACDKDKKDIFEEVYEIEMIGQWNESSHSIDFPNNAHFSPFVGLSHLAGLDVIGEGLIATEGIKQMAETGSTNEIIKEFIQFKKQNYSEDTVVAQGFASPGRTSAQIGVKRGYHNVTLFSMIAPSPDWFVAAKVELIDPVDGKWYDKVTVHAKTYDSGTDSGITFTSENEETIPADSIFEIKTNPLASGTDSVRNIASFVFTRVK